MRTRVVLEALPLPIILKERTRLMTPDLVCPSTYQFLWSSFGDSGPDVSYDMSASLKHLFGLARARLATSIMR
ncbi:hypothetical protein Tco_1158454 [Tanacetum coccineum]